MNDYEKIKEILEKWDKLSKELIETIKAIAEKESVNSQQLTYNLSEEIKRTRNEALSIIARLEMRKRALNLKGE